MRYVYAAIAIVLLLFSSAFAVVTLPHTFSGNTTVPLSWLDDNFSTLSTAVNTTTYTNVVNSEAYTTLNTAYAAVSGNGTIYINSNIPVVAPGLTIRRGVKIIVLGNGGIVLNAPLTIHGEFVAGIQSVFTGASTVSFGNSLLNESAGIPWVYPQWWGALGDGAHDDVLAIQAAMNTNQRVILPIGNYRISNTLQLQTYNHIEGVDPTVKISPIDKTKSVFTNNTTGTILRFIHRNFIIDYTTANAGGPPDVSSAGYVLLNSGIPYEFTLDNIQVWNAYYGIYDASLGFMMDFRMVHLQGCEYGFYMNKPGGTTIKMHNVYSNACRRNEIHNVSEFTMLNCAIDLADSGDGVDGLPLFINNSQAVNLIGLHLEQNKQRVDTGGILMLNGVTGYNISGLRTFLNTMVTTTGTTVSLIKVAGGSTGTISHSFFGSNAEDNFTGSGTAITVSIDNTSKLDLHHSWVSEPSVSAGATGTRYLFSNSSGVTSNLVVSGSTTSGNTLGGQPTFGPAIISTSFSFPSVTISTASYATTTVSVVGARIGDTSLASSGTITSGVSLWSNVTDTDIVSVTAVNVSGGNKNLGGNTVKLNVVKSH